MPPFKISPAVRKKILEKLFGSSASREKLLEKAGPALEEFLDSPKIKRAYIGGSSASGKLDPKDIDVFYYTGEEFGVPALAERAKSKGFKAKPERIANSELEIDGFNPGDVDLNYQYKKFLQDSGIDPVHIEKFSMPRGTEAAKGARQRWIDYGADPAVFDDYIRSSETSEWLDEARKRYGPDYKWIRILSLIGALKAAEEEDGKR